ncbi:hypothetical protein H310_01785 [Aphanomyces invadans]|uniref:Uncharacterized protein n=1 Tax=Aphanomyces invadans TaxID=157072 RepID=A0A024UL31_9STRA|nr:hypothetical protein H310_01785 [Aphanomyces invadans]ETW07156.1 hypothetical protein H310_01785 [Aphanomyces invadans]|eukprot:XP_008863249.1 hypothetical protein H310_01785 [Aphanomyces invadans]
MSPGLDVLVAPAMAHSILTKSHGCSSVGRPTARSSRPLVNLWSCLFRWRRVVVTFVAFLDVGEVTTDVADRPHHVFHSDEVLTIFVGSMDTAGVKLPVVGCAGICIVGSMEGFNMYALFAGMVDILREDVFGVDAVSGRRDRSISSVVVAVVRDGA